MKFQITKGSTSVILTVFIQDSSSSTGAGLASLIHTSSIAGGYVKRNGVGVALAVDEDVTTEGTYQAPSVVGKVRIGTPANMIAGTYELHFHNDLFTTADWVTITLAGATNMAPLTLEVQLVSMDFNDAVRGGISSLPNAAADAAGGLVISDAGGLDIDAMNAAAVRLTAVRAAVLTDLIDGGRLDLILDIIAADTTTDIPALIAALNDLTSADVNAACDTALADYGANTVVPPTVAQMNARTIVSASYATAASIAALKDFDPAADTVTNVGTVATVTNDVNITSPFKKNTALANIPFEMVDETDGFTPEPSKTVTATRSIDGGAYGAVSGTTISELANGSYSVDISAADNNGTVIHWKMAATGCADTKFTIVNPT